MLGGRPFLRWGIDLHELRILKSILKRKYLIIKFVHIYFLNLYDFNFMTFGSKVKFDLIILFYSFYI